MQLKADLRTLLTAQAAITALVGTNADSRDPCIRPERLFAKDARPCLVIHLEEDDPLSTLEGCGPEHNIETNFLCIADRQEDAEALADALKTYLEPFSGATANGTIESVTWLPQPSSWQPYGDGSDEGEFVVACAAKIWYVEDSGGTA